MVDTSQLTELISALRAETEANSVSPERVGYVLQQIVDFLPTLDSSGLTNDVATALSTARQALSTAQGATTTANAAQTAATSAQNVANSASATATQAKALADAATDAVSALAALVEQLQTASETVEGLIGNIEIPIVNDLTTGGNEIALSAEMGKIIKENVAALLNALGNYAFPEGKPVLDWSPMTAQVILDLNDVSSSNTSKSTTRGRAYTTTLTSSIASNLYIVDATVVMNGVDITSTAYNPNTGVISIAEVTGAIAITASAITYIAAGLQLHLDGKNRGGVTGHWRSLVSAHDYELLNVVEAADGVIFDDTGNSYGTGNAVNVTCDVGTIEVVINSDSVVNGGSVFANGIAKGIAFSGWDYGGLKGYVNQTAPSSASIVNPNAAIRTTVSSGYFSLTNASALVNGVQTQVVMGNYPWRTGFTGSSYIGRLASTKFFTGKILAIRIYDRQLSADEMQMNYKIDKQRFGL